MKVSMAVDRAEVALSLAADVRGHADPELPQLATAGAKYDPLSTSATPALATLGESAAQARIPLTTLAAVVIAIGCLSLARTLRDDAASQVASSLRVASSDRWQREAGAFGAAAAGDGDGGERRNVVGSGVVVAGAGDAASAMRAALQSLVPTASVTASATATPSLTATSSLTASKTASLTPLPLGMSRLPTPSDDPADHVIVVATSPRDVQPLGWLQQFLSDKCVLLYSHDDAGPDSPWRPLLSPGNVGFEATAYLQFIVDFYDDLPGVTAFIHGQCV